MIYESYITAILRYVVLVIKYGNHKFTLRSRSNNLSKHYIISYIGCPILELFSNINSFFFWCF